MFCGLFQGVIAGALFGPQLNGSTLPVPLPEADQGCADAGDVPMPNIKAKPRASAPKPVMILIFMIPIFMTHSVFDKLLINVKLRPRVQRALILVK